MIRRLGNAWRWSAIFAITAAAVLTDVRFALGADAGGDAGGDDRTHALSWGLVLLCLVLGLLVTLRPSRRAGEVKRPVRDDD